MTPVIVPLMAHLLFLALLPPLLLLFLITCFAMIQSPHSHTPGTSACGWLFHESDVFDKDRLAQLLTLLAPYVLRLKGIFRWVCGSRLRWGPAWSSDSGVQPLPEYMPQWV